MGIITAICCLLVVIPFSYRLRNLYRVNVNSKDSSWNSTMRTYLASKGKIIPNKTLVEANTVINVESLYAANDINYSKLKSTASSLVGLGILGTFFGLSVALLADLNLSDTETTISSVHSLLGGMKTAFYTSVLGMGTSIAFGFLMRAHINKLQEAIVKTCNKLDDENLASAATLFNENNKLIAAQNELLSQLGKSIGNSISERISNVFTIGAQKLENQLEKQTTLMRQTSEDVTLQLQASTQNLNDIFTEQNVVIKGMATNLGSSVKNIVTDELENSFKALMDAVTTKISSELVEAATRLQESTESLNNSATTLQNGSTTIVESAKGLNDAANNLGLSAETIKEYSVDLGSRADKISDNIDKLNQTISEIGDASNQFGSAAANATDNINGITEALKEIDMEDIHGTINEFLNSIDDFVEKIDNVSELVKEMPNAKDIIKEISSATAEYISTLHEKVKELTSTYTTTFTDACESINGTIRKLDSTMTSAKDNTEASTNRIVGVVTKATDNLNKAIIALRQNETQRN